MRFGEHFESLKIPEWHNMYLDYEELKRIIDDFIDSIKTRHCMKLTENYRFKKDPKTNNCWKIYRQDEDGVDGPHVNKSTTELRSTWKQSP